MVYFRHMRGGLNTSGRSVRPWLQVWRFLSAPGQGGFTVIEVLIVLAVTSALFVSAAIMIVGRQNRTAFEQSVRNVQSQIQSAIDEVVVGHYPNKGSFSCAADASGPLISAGAGEQGTNGDCIFMGKVIQFKVANTDPEEFRTYTIAGLRKSASTGEEVTSRAEAMPLLIAPSTANPGIPDRATTEILEAGLTASSVSYGSPATQVGGIAIWQSLASISGGTLTSGAQAASIGPVVGTTLDMGQLAFVDAANLTSGPLDDVNGIKLCFVSGSTDQSGLITLGGNNRRLTVTLDMKSNKTCS